MVDKISDSNEQMWQRERQVLVDAVQRAQAEAVETRRRFNPWERGWKPFVWGIVTGSLAVLTILSATTYYIETVIPSPVTAPAPPRPAPARPTPQEDNWSRGYAAGSRDGFKVGKEAGKDLGRDEALENAWCPDSKRPPVYAVHPVFARYSCVEIYQ